MKVTRILPLLCCLFASPLAAQHTDNNSFTGCGADLVHKLHPELNGVQEQNDQAIYHAAGQAAGLRGVAQALRTLPVVVHIVHNGGPENISDAQVQQGIAHLNAAFNASFGTGVNTEVQFCLAQRDPLGQLSTGITRNQSALAVMELESQDLALKDLNRWSPTCYINIWLVAEISSASAGSGVAGYAYFPSAHGTAVDGIVMEAGYFGSSQSNTSVLVHEMGHYLGLYHTFQGGCGNGDCLLDGDRVCDTPPDQTTFSSCNPNANSCNTDTDDLSSNNPFTSDVPDLGEDYMDYSSLQCFSKFTQGQSERMNWHITNVRSSLLNCLSCQTPCPAPLTAHITLPSTPQTIAVGGTLSFSATASNAAGYAWMVGSGPVISTSLGASYTFNTTGVFWVTFKAVSGNPAECADAADSVQVNVLCDVQAVFSVPPVLVNGLAATFVNNSVNAVGYQWFLDNSPVSTNAGLDYTFVNTGVYQLCLIAAGNMCSDTLCATVYVQPNGSDSTGCDNTFIEALAGMGGSAPNIFPHPNGDFFATGLRNDSIVLVRFDQSGAPLWARAFRFGNLVLQVTDMFVDASGDLIGIAHFETGVLSQVKSTAFRYNITSNSFAWIQHFDNVYFQNIHSLNATHCVITGTSDEGYTLFTRILKNTGAVNGYNLEGEKGDFFSTVYNGSIYGACRRYYNAFGDFRASVFAHNLNTGAFQWQNAIISEGNTSGANQTRMYPVKPVVDNNQLVVLTSGDLVGFDVASNGPLEMVVAKTSLTGDVIWTKQYVIAGYNRPVATAIVPTATGYYIVCNLYLPSVSNYGFSALIKTDKNGNVQWAKRLGISGVNIARNIMERNGFLYLTMTSNSYAPNEYLLVKLDQNGEAGADCNFLNPVSVTTIDLANVQNVRNYNVTTSGKTSTPQSTQPAATPLVWEFHCNTPCECPALPVLAGSDTLICKGESVLLQAAPGFDSYSWTPAATLDHPNIQTPLATPLVTTTYTVNVLKLGTELVVNSDFSLGNTGFISEYIYDNMGYGHYWVTANPLIYNPQWQIPLDHSPTSDNLMLLFDGDVTGNLPDVWRQTILVQPGTDYVFEFWSAMAYFAAPPNIEIRINGVVQDVFTLQGGAPWVSVWQPYTLNINSGTATQFTISMRNLNTQSLGNDFALDDISLRTICQYSDSITVSINNISNQTLDLGPDIAACANAVHTFDAGIGFAAYLWQDGSTESTFTAFGPGTYRVSVQDSCGGMQHDTVLVIGAPAPELDLGADKTICAGDSVQLSYASSGVFNTFNWSPSNGLNCTLCPAPVAKPAITTVFYLAASTADGCTNLDSISVIVTQPGASAQNIVRCDNQPFFFNGHVYTTSGIYLDTLVNINGCDSVVTTNLSILPKSTRSETITFCPGESVMIGGNTYNQPGTVIDTLPAASGCDTVVTYTLQYLTPAPSDVSIDCPDAISIGIQPGAGPTVVHYNLPVAGTDCICPGIALTLTSGLVSGSEFPLGNTVVCYTAKDSCGNTASCCFDVYIREESACDIKEIGCMKYELLGITANPAQQYTYRIRVTNFCANKLIYTAIQIPDGVTALSPGDLSIFTAESGRKYHIRNPNLSPFWSVRYKSDADSISGGQSDILQYTLPAQAQPLYIHITSRLSPQVFYEAHLNTFYCPVGVTPDGDKPAERITDSATGEHPGLRIFPNPTGGVLYADLSDWLGEQVSIRIFNAQGGQIENTSVLAVGEPYLIPLPDNLSGGLYIFEATSAGGSRQALRFVFER
ncbi:MAG: HYR domain-containing protein [Lewinellaceae bacterium]|nr:HYR domain-containing protein [Lewinellaceae bacterium]